MHTLTLHTAATAQPVSLDEAKLHLRVTDTAEDTLIQSLIDAATDEAENITRRALMPQKWKYTADRFPGTVYPHIQWPPHGYQNLVSGVLPIHSREVFLRRPPITGVDSVQYVDETGALVTLDPSQYQVASASDYSARVVPAFGLTWPVTRLQPEAVQIVFSCGYADAASVPGPIKAWIKLRIGALYENREEMVVGQRLVRLDLPFVDSLLDRYRAADL